MELGKPSLPVVHVVRGERRSDIDPLSVSGWALAFASLELEELFCACRTTREQPRRDCSEQSSARNHRLSMLSHGSIPFNRLAFGCRQRPRSEFQRPFFGERKSTRWTCGLSSTRAVGPGSGIFRAIHRSEAPGSEAFWPLRRVQGKGGCGLREWNRMGGGSRPGSDAM